MDLALSLMGFGRSTFCGGRISICKSLNLFALPKDELLPPRRVFAKEFDADYQRSDNQAPRKPSSRGPKFTERARFEENVETVWDTPARRISPVDETPGERFLNRALRRKTPKDDNMENKGSIKGSTTTKKRKEMPQKNLLNHSQPSCYGCGALLQTSESEAPGYVPPQTFELKKRHHQLKAILCGRCRLLSQGQMIPAVGGVGGYGNGIGYVPAEQLRAQLSHLRHQKALIVKLVDIVDFNGSFLGRVRDLVRANPIILVLTKVDLLPEGTDFSALSDWLQEAVMRKKLNVISIHLTSAKAKTGISNVAADIMRQRMGRDVYILGSANVGKSAFVTALLEDMGRRDLVAAAALRFKPIQSAMPGTTLGAIEFQAFNGRGKLYDTPGVHLHHRMAAAVDPQDVQLLAPCHRLRGYSIGPMDLREEEPEEERLFGVTDLDSFLRFRPGAKYLQEKNPLPNIHEKEKEEQDTNIHEEQREEHEGRQDQDGSWRQEALVGYSLFWGGIVRMDVIKAPEDVKFTFYGPSAIRVVKVPSREADAFYKENIGHRLTPPSVSTLGSWAGMEKVQEISLIAEKLSKYPAGDLAISGLGWITIGKANILEESLEEPPEEESMGVSKDSLSTGVDSEESPGFYNDDDEIVIILHTPKAVEIFIRPSIPLGKKAAKWYDYSDLTDAELEARPQLFY